MRLRKQRGQRARQRAIADDSSLPDQTSKLPSPLNTGPGKLFGLGQNLQQRQKMAFFQPRQRTAHFGSRDIILSPRSRGIRGIRRRPRPPRARSSASAAPHSRFGLHFSVRYSSVRGRRRARSALRLRACKSGFGPRRRRFAGRAAGLTTRGPPSTGSALGRAPASISFYKNPVTQ